MKQLSLEAKTRIIHNALNKKGKALRVLAETHNIGYSTLQKWVKQCRHNEGIFDKKLVKSGSELSREARFNHILAISGLDEKAIGSYCREHGLYSFQLTQWKQEFMTNDSTQDNAKQSHEIKVLKAEIKLKCSPKFRPPQET